MARYYLTQKEKKTEEEERKIRRRERERERERERMRMSEQVFSSFRGTEPALVAPLTMHTTWEGRDPCSPLSSSPPPFLSTSPASSSCRSALNMNAPTV